MKRPRAIRVRAHAKLNLSLRVGARQADGFHPLQTVYQSLALHDLVEVTPRRGPFALACDDAGVPTDDRNLVTRAARQLWAVTGRDGEPRDVAIRLAKHIPMQAGLGGGSADAAAALVALARIWRPLGEAPALAAIAAQVGSDVTYFLVGGTALGLGRGEDLYPLIDLPAFRVVLALPGFGVSTADAYRWLDEDRARGVRGQARGGGAVDAWPGRVLEVANDLEGPVARRHPQVAAMRDTLAAAGATAAGMTGSGSAVFGLFEGDAGARRAATAVAESGWVAVLTRTVDRRTCHRVHFSFASSSPRHA